MGWGGRSGPGGKEWAGGGRSGPGGKEWAWADWVVVRYIYAYFQDFLFDFLKRFQETEPFYFRSSSITDYSETFWLFIPGD